MKALIIGIAFIIGVLFIVGFMYILIYLMLAAINKIMDKFNW